MPSKLSDPIRELQLTIGRIYAEAQYTGCFSALRPPNATAALQPFVPRTGIGMQATHFQLRLRNLSLFAGSEHLKISNTRNVIKIPLISLTLRTGYR